MDSLGCHTKVRQLLTGRKRRLLKSRPQSTQALSQGSNIFTNHRGTQGMA